MVTHSNGAGVMGQFSLGARSGLFTRKPSVDGLTIAVLNIAALATERYRVAETATGPVEYVRRLGLPVDDQTLG